MTYLEQAIELIEKQISRLEEAKSILQSEETGWMASAPPVRRGRPAKSADRPKRIMSPEARERIAEAQRRRHSLNRGEETPTPMPQLPAEVLQEVYEEASAPLSKPKKPKKQEPDEPLPM